jgi:hypothetical protein
MEQRRGRSAAANVAFGRDADNTSRLLTEHADHLLEHRHVFPHVLPAVGVVLVGTEKPGVSGATWLGMPPGKLNCLNSRFIPSASWLMFG